MKALTHELNTALAAVRAATSVCRSVQKQLVSEQTLQKKDKSPVTVADFASQAIVCAKLAEALPGDAIVGEEDSHELRRDEQAALRKLVVEHVSGALGATVDESKVLAWIDRGNAQAAGGRYWTLDPIDGTKGFLRGEQYAVALALIENGRVVLGALGCPNLSGDNGEAGVLLAAVRGRGAKAYPLWRDDHEGKTIRVSAIARTSEARFCESVESGHSDQDQSAQIAARLGITSEPVRIDSQCKYAVVARGEASIYLRLPTRADYRECIWDHAAGMIVVEEAGGKVTDIAGKPLDFAVGRKLDNNRGIIASSGAIHEAVLEAVTAVLK